jgi:hypothetical protein
MLQRNGSAVDPVINDGVCPREKINGLCLNSKNLSKKVRFCSLKKNADCLAKKGQKIFLRWLDDISVDG